MKNDTIAIFYEKINICDKFEKANQKRINHDVSKLNL